MAAQNPDKAKVNDWLGQNWKGTYQPSEKEKREHKYQQSQAEAAGSSSTTNTQQDSDQSATGGIAFPDSDYTRGGAGFASINARNKRAKVKPMHHWHHHFHTEVALDQLPYLETSDFLIIRSFMVAGDDIPHFDGTSPYSRYQVWDRNRTVLYTGVEVGSFFCQFLLGPSRPFQINLYNAEGVLSIIVRRPGNCFLWFFGGHYFANGARIEDPKGKILGTVTQSCCSLKPTYDIRDKTGRSQLFALGTTKNPVHVMFQRIHFNLFTTEEGENVGLFTRHHWQQILQPMRRDTEEGSSFGVAFPQCMDENMRISIMGAAFLLCISYFEHKTGGLAGIDIIFYLILAAIAVFIIYGNFYDAFFVERYIPWCQRERFNNCINAAGNATASNTTTIAPKNI